MDLPMPVVMRSSGDFHGGESVLVDGHRSLVAISETDGEVLLEIFEIVD